MNLTGLPLNWFDLVVAVVLIAGAVVGRKKGMSEELLPLFQWLAIVVVGALYYEPIGKLLARFAPISLLLAYVTVYVVILVAHKFFFNWCKTLVGEKLVSADWFGGAEFYLGMVAGTLRFACVLLAALALLNAREITAEELAAERRMQRENFGSVAFPTLGRVQQSVFVHSASGRFVKQYLSDQLIASTPAGQRLTQRESIGRRRERAVDEVLGR